MGKDAGSDCIGRAKTLQEWEFELHSLSDAIRDDPTNQEEYKARIKAILPKWASKLDITIFQANNEQNPLPETWLKYPVRPMLQKSTTGYDQTGDYVFFIDGHAVSEINKWGGFIVERKSILDLYGTLYGYSKTGEKNRIRLYREIDRFHQLPWADSFIIMVEGMDEDFYNLIPPRRNCRFCQFFKPDPVDEKEWGLCLFGSEINMVDPLSDCYHFVDSESDEERIEKIRTSKEATIAGLEVMPGVQMIWCGSRQKMAKKYNDMIRLWCMQNWKRILGIVVYDKEERKWVTA